MKQRIALLGSTGSIGKNTLAVVREHPDQFEVVGLAAGSNVQEMVRQIREFSPRIVSMASPEAAEQVRWVAGPGVRVVCGEEGGLEVATHPGACIVVSAIVDSRGLCTTLAAIRARKTMSIDN